MYNYNLQQGGDNGEDNILLLLFIIAGIILYFIC